MHFLLISDHRIDFCARQGVTGEKEQTTKLLGKAELALTFESVS